MNKKKIISKITDDYVFKCKKCKFMWTNINIPKKCPRCGSDQIKEL